MFNPWRTLRNASCAVLFAAWYLKNPYLVLFGFGLMMTAMVGGIDLAERRIELLEKFLLKEKDDEKTETPEGH